MAAMHSWSHSSTGAGTEKCVGEGCSVEAMMALDQKLAADEAKVMMTMDELKKDSKTNLKADKGSIKWLQNFLARAGGLRGQLMAVKEVKDTNLVKQLVKAASIAFGAES